MTSHADVRMWESVDIDTTIFDLPGPTPLSTRIATAPLDRSSRFGMSSDIASEPKDNGLETALDGPKPPPTLSRPLSVDVNKSKVSTIELLAEWNGCVMSIHSSGHSFSASLKGVVGEGVKDEEEDATIPISDVSEWDKDLLVPGNFFRLCVVHEVLPSGQPRRYTQVVFRRLPAYRRHDLDQAAERGRELARGLRVE